MILSRLNKMTYATRSQLQEACGLGAVRNANRILLRLEGEGLIKSTRWRQKVYRLTREGRYLIDDDYKPSHAREYIEHTLASNEAYLALEMPEDWRTEQHMSFRGKNGKVSFTPDANCSVNNRKLFIEVDRYQRMNINRDKIEVYAELQSLYRKNGKQPPVIKFYGICPTRVDRIRRMMSEADVEGTAELIV